MTYDVPFQTAVTFEVSLNLTSYYRRVYSILDLLSDVGGLFGAISPLCLAITGFFQYYGPYQFVMADLFKRS